MTAPPPHPSSRAALRCEICDAPIDGVPLDDTSTGHVAHPACVAARLPQDALVASIAAAVLVLGPAVVVWAG
jgi:hypothetical protein